MSPRPDDDAAMLRAARGDAVDRIATIAREQAAAADALRNRVSELEDVVDHLQAEVSRQQALCAQEVAKYVACVDELRQIHAALDAATTAAAAFRCAVARAFGAPTDQPDPMIIAVIHHWQTERARALKAVEAIAARFNVPVLGFDDAAPALDRVLFRVEELQREYGRAAESRDRWKRRANRVEPPKTSRAARVPKTKLPRAKGSSR